MVKIYTAQEAADEACRTIEGYRTGAKWTMRTRWPKLNRQLMNGFELNTIVTLAGLSGHAKSTIANLWQADFAKRDPNLITLYFSLEMSPERQFIRNAANKLNMQVRELFSADTRLDEVKMSAIKNEMNLLGAQKIFFVSDAVTVDDIEKTTRAFKNRCIDENKTLLVIIDHTLLVTGVSGDSAKQTIDLLQTKLNFLKKTGRILIVQLAQMNRDIEGTTRVLNENMHYPTKSDISSSDNMYQLSDYVIITHMPERLNITRYGPHKIPTKDRVFLHICKNRDAGKPCVLKFINDLAHGNLIEDNERIEPQQLTQIPFDKE